MSFCQRLLEDVANSTRNPDVSQQPWMMTTGKAGDNAVLKISVDKQGQSLGYIITVARHQHTEVIEREVSILTRLHDTLPSSLANTIPQLVHADTFETLPYFIVPKHMIRHDGRLRRRWHRDRRCQWISTWLQDFALATKSDPLGSSWFTDHYASTIESMHSDPTMANQTCDVVSKHFEQVINYADNIPSVCCHGDMWQGNILWDNSGTALVIDWGAAQWPGLPGVDLCRFVLNNPWPLNNRAAALRDYCQAIDLDIQLIPALYDMYSVFIKKELDHAYDHQPHAKINPFQHGPPSQGVQQILF